MKTAPLAREHRNMHIPACNRCHRRPGEYRWTAITHAAERVMVELRLCHDCLQPLNSFMTGYENKIRQKSEAAMAKSGGRAR